MLAIMNSRTGDTASLPMYCIALSSDAVTQTVLRGLFGA